MLLVVHKTQHAGGTGGATQQALHFLGGSEGKTGGGDDLGKISGAKGLVSRHEKQKEASLLLVCQKQILAHGTAEATVDFDTILHRGRRRVIEMGIGN